MEQTKIFDIKVEQFVRSLDGFKKHLDLDLSNFRRRFSTNKKVFINNSFKA